MKILQISAVYNIGSVGKIVRDNHLYFLSNGHDSTVLFAAGKSDEKNAIKICNKPFRTLSKVMYRITGLNFVWNPITTNKIIRFIKKKRPDIVHIHCYNDYYLNINTLLSYLAKHNFKTVITQHAEHYFTGSCGYSIDCELWKENGCSTKECPLQKNRKTIFKIKSKLMWKKLNKTFSLFDDKNIAVVSCTPWLQERADKSVILKRFSNKFVVFNGADSKLYKYRDFSKDKKLVLYVTPRFDDPIKGSKHINDIAKLYLDDDRVSFLMVGNVPNTFKLEKNIVYLGPKYGDELAKLYSKSDATIMLSKRECFPMVCVESVLSGTKVVAFKCGGPDKQYSKEFASFVEWGDFNALKKELDSILNNLYDKKKISEAASKLYSKEIMSNNYLTVYKTLIQQ